MNVAKYYREQNGKVQIHRRRFPQSHAAGHGIAQVDREMYLYGFTRRRPAGMKPHQHHAQQPGYRQPTQQQLRRARQTLRKGNQWPR